MTGTMGYCAWPVFWVNTQPVPWVNAQQHGGQATPKASLAVNQTRDIYHLLIIRQFKICIIL